MVNDSFYHVVMQNGKLAKGFCPTVFNSYDEAFRALPLYVLSLRKYGKFTVRLCVGSSSGIDYTAPLIEL